MKRTFLVTVSACALMGAANAQQYQQRANIVGGGTAGEGKCTVEVLVDGAAEVSIRGDRATLRNLNGRAPQWRRFECTSAMPPNPSNFRFQGVDGRGRQELLRDPSSGGVAVVRIEDPDGGAEGYTFDVTWSGSGYGNQPYGNPPYGNQPYGNQPYGSADRSGPTYNNRGVFGDYSDGNTAIAACQDAVRQEAARRFGAQSIDFRRERLEDEPGVRDTVRGRFFAIDGYNNEQPYRYSCTVNSRNGRVSNVTIEPAGRGNPNNRGNDGVSGRYENGSSPVMSCQQAVRDQMARDGYGNVSFGNTTLNNRRGRIEGTARAFAGNGGSAFDFTCALDNYGNVQNVDVRRR